MSNLPELPKGTKIGKYKVEFLLGAGGFGHVYKVIDSNKQIFALKTEKDDLEYSFLNNEIRCLSRLKQPCFPNIRESGHQHKFNYYVMNIYGISVHSLCKTRKLPIESSFPISYKMFTVISTLHQSGYIHRDIKPSNFLFQLSKTDPLVLIDFGLALEYIDQESGEIIEYEQNRFAGTKKYASIFAHKYNQLGRRDDLISWIYSSIETMTGTLPWSSCEDENQLISIKEGISAEKLCENVPVVFRKIFKYLLALNQNDKPSYEKIDKHLMKSMKENNINFDEVNWSSFYM